MSFFERELVLEFVGRMEEDRDLARGVQLPAVTQQRGVFDTGRFDSFSQHEPNGSIHC